jgi:glycosyltransferase involved in cell wall biosynthesis
MNNGNDISIGYRVGDNTEMPMWRRVGKRVLDYTTSMGTGGFVTDSQCGFRAFNKKAVEGITPILKGDAFSVESEQLIKAHELGLNVVNTNVTCKYKDLQTSTKNPASHGISVLSYALWLVAEQHPLLFIGLPGFIMVLIGLYFGISTIQYYNMHHIFLDPSAILISIFLIIGMLAMFIGLMLYTLPNILKKFKE